MPLELRINRYSFLLRVKKLFDFEVNDTPVSPRFSDDYKNALYITYLLALDDIRENIMNSGLKNNEVYIDLLKSVVESDIAKLTYAEKKEISDMLNDGLSVLLSTSYNFILELKTTPYSRLYDIHYSGVVSFSRRIEDVYIKNKILGLETRDIDDYLNQLNIDKLFNMIKSLKDGSKFSKSEIIVFEDFAKIKYMIYSSNMDSFLMKNIPRYSQYLAMKIVDDADDADG